MIIDPTFTKHWKTKRLTRLLNDPAAPVYVINLWAHCQVSHKSTLDIPLEAIAEICDYDGDPDAFARAMIECRFIDAIGDGYQVHQWEEYNASLISARENGKKGGRPRKTRQEPSGNPSDTHAQPNANPSETDGFPEDGDDGDEDGDFLPGSWEEITQAEPSKNPSQTHGKPSGNPSATHRQPKSNPRESDRWMDRGIEGKKEEIPPNPPAGGLAANPSSKSSKNAEQNPVWSVSDGWQNVEGCISGWEEAFPACDIRRQLASMDAWLRANPQRARKSNWPRFIVNWLTKQQDRGGDVQSVPTRPQEAPGRSSSKPLTTWEIKERLKACENALTDLEYPGGCAYAVELHGEKLARADRLRETIRSLRAQMTEVVA
ncbi:MAG: hypothetical protein JW942_06890 [Opitutales bacterium]|nr:hypothetical protein [Opitutales bacterium]